VKKSNGKAAAIEVSGFGENEALRAEIQSGQVSEGAAGVQGGQKSSSAQENVRGRT